MLRNTNKNFGSVSKMFHWVTVGLFCYLFYLALTMIGLESSTEKWQLYAQHKQFGVLLFILVLFRVLWKVINTTPEQAAGTPKWKIYLASLTHFTLYLIMLGFPISGIVMSMAGNHDIVFFGYTLPNIIGENKEISGVARYIHGILEYIAYSVIGLHVIAALYHHFIEKDNILKRMLPFKK